MTLKVQEDQDCISEVKSLDNSLVGVAHASTDFNYEAIDRYSAADHDSTVLISVSCLQVLRV